MSTIFVPTPAPLVQALTSSIRMFLRILGMLCGLLFSLFGLFMAIRTRRMAIQLAILRNTPELVGVGPGEADRSGDEVGRPA
jgi:hypothetical protein